MAEKRYQARGPENRTTLITVRVTAEHRELLRALADERGETVTRMLLSPWLGAKDKKPSRPVKRSGRRPVVAATAAPAEAAENAGPQETLAQVHVEQRAPLVVSAKRRRRVNPGQEALLLN